MRLGRELATNSLEIGVLSSFAFAQPLFDLLSRNVEFLVVRRSQPLDLVLFILVLCLVLPAALMTLELLVAVVSQKVLPWLHGFLMSVLVAVTLLPVLKRLGTLPGLAWLALTLMLGLAFSFAHWRLTRVRTLLLWLSPAALLFPALFVLISPVRKVAFPSQITPTVSASQASAPIVMVIFDEFPLISLLDEDRKIDSALYPNFAALSRAATWYRNATTVSEGTLNAIPAIVDGQYPRVDLQRLPNAADHPFSLFRLLGKAYQFNVIENNTRLCPDDLCGDSGGGTRLGERMRGLLSDVSILYLYFLLPSDLTIGLPDVTHSWRDFAARFQQAESPWLVYDKLAKWDNRIEIFRDFIGSIKPSPKPALHFLHILLPHAIWEFLPSGKKYTLPEQGIRGVLGPNERGEDTNKWTSDAWTVTQSYQRHLLQVGLIDRLVGELISHLKTMGLYDPALIVITADHGASFRPNDSRRSVTRTNYPDIMAVPLFIKLPHQKEGEISDRNVETIDILPTMADILRIELPWKIDGCSMLDASLPERTEKIIISDQREKFVFDPALDAKYESLSHKLTLFGSPDEQEPLFRVGPHHELIGRPVESPAAISDLRVELDTDGHYNNVEVNSPLVLTHITGEILRPHPENFRPLQLAVAANGVIRAVTETYEAGEKERFAALLPESALRPGHNEIEVYFVSGPAASESLEKTRKLAVPDYRWGNIAHFAAKGNGVVYQAEGWGIPEQEYTWNDGKRARIVLPIAPLETAVMLTMSVGGHVVPGKVDRQRVRIWINQKPVGEWLVTSSGLHEQTLKVPREFLAGSPELVITLEMPDAVSPASLGAGSDLRELAIALAWLQVTPRSN